MKKGLTISIIVIMLALGGAALWYFFFHEPSELGENPFGNALPFGSGEGVDLPLPVSSGPNSEDAPGVENGKPVESLFQVTGSPVAGAVVIGQGASTTVRYTDRATGHIYDVNLVTLEARKVTNTTLPKIYEAVFNSDGSRVVFRSLDDAGTIENLALTLTPPTSTSTDALYTASATVLRGDMSELEAGAGNRIYFISEDSSSVVTSTFEGTGQSTILTSPFTAWRLDMFGTGLLAWTKADPNSPGYAYSLNTSNGSLSKVLGPFNGLSVKPNLLGTKVLFSYNDGGKTRLFSRNIASQSNIELFPATLAEKCVWGQITTDLVLCGSSRGSIGSNEPENWYKGSTNFSDNLWRIDSSTTETLLAAEPEELYNTSIDVYEPRLSADEGYLVFINKNDLSLWALKLD